MLRLAEVVSADSLVLFLILLPGVRSSIEWLCQRPLPRRHFLHVVLGLGVGFPILWGYFMPLGTAIVGVVSLIVGLRLATFAIPVFAAGFLHHLRDLLINFTLDKRIEFVFTPASEVELGGILGSGKHVRRTTDYYTSLRGTYLQPCRRTNRVHTFLRHDFSCCFAVKMDHFLELFVHLHDVASEEGRKSRNTDRSKSIDKGKKENPFPLSLLIKLLTKWTGLVAVRDHILSQFVGRREASSSLCRQ